MILWRNLRRLAEAVGAVHGQGLVHGRIDARAIYTAGAATDADFRLGGFEFSLRMAELYKAPLGPIGRSGSMGVIFSFLDDWRGIGRAVAELLGLDAALLADEDIVFLQGRARIELRPSEINLVRMLVQPERNRSLDAQIVLDRVDQVLGELESEALANNGHYVLALRFGQTSRLSGALNAASGDAFDVDEADPQLDFVEADIDSGVTLVRAARGDIYLLTESLAYDLKPLRAAGTDETWKVAVCTNARPRDNVHLGRREDLLLSAQRIELIHLGAATRRLRELRTDALDWTAAFAQQAKEDRTLAVRRGLLLVQICEALFKAAEIAPVEVVVQPARGGKRFVELAASDSESRMRLAATLRVDDPHKLLRRLFEREEADLDAEWQLSESAGLGSAIRAAATVRFSQVLQKENRRVYEFEVIDGVVAANADLHLRKVDDTGTEQVLRRRLRMLAALATQSELASMLTDPRARIRTYRNEPLVEDKHFADLDESKQEALRSAWSTGPGQFVVGPPGVGKTKLVTEIVRRTLAEDPTARLLLSAQAHQALDNLAAAVQKKLKATGLDKNAILVRSRADRGFHLSGAQTPDRAKSYLGALLESKLVAGAPAVIKSSLDEMKKAAGVRGNLRTRLPLSTLRQRRSFEALVLQAANILFSTTNSGDLERLIDDGAQFDWTIVEEAAKATGPELLAPQLLSMRRLLIGDHNQLPPFDTDRVAALLEDQSRVKSALTESDLVVGNIFRDFGLDDLREAVDDDAVLSETCAVARRMLLLFESLVTGELERQKRYGEGRRRVATELLEQHRMHPVIGSVISEVFYEGRLETSLKRAREFETEISPVIVSDGRLPLSPIVFVDLPYVQREGGAGEQFPTYHNPAEVEAVLAILGMVRGVPNAQGEDATLAVLSPYNRQVERLGRAVEDRLTTHV